MTDIRSQKGYDIPVSGAPSAEVDVLPPPRTLALLPERIPFVKPRLAVQEGERVRIGQVLFRDKRNPHLAFVSPGGGRVVRIDFGPKRVIREIVVEREASEAAVSFDPVDEGALSRMPRGAIVERLLEGGVWPFLRALPFRDIAPHEANPPAIFVGLGAREPFLPDPDVYLAGREALFRLGMAALGRLSDRVVVHAEPGHGAAVAELVTHRVHGRYPADDPGVALYHLRREASDNRAWFVSGQDLLVIGGFLAAGAFPTERVVCRAGSLAERPVHLRTRLGAPLGDIAGSGTPSGADVRFVVGGLLRGYAAPAHHHLGLYETALAVVPEPAEKEFLAFVRPGYDRPSYSRTFLSRWNPGPFRFDTNRKGGLRACIACGYCAEVCPVDIWPQMTLKAILVDEVEEYLAHGLLDCVECGLCTYVCPSKIELAETFQATKRSYHREQNRP